MNLSVDFEKASLVIDAEFKETAHSFDADIGEVIDNTREPIIKPLRVTENGEYRVGTDADGYSPVIVDVIGGNVEEYKGDYEVTPAITAQVLETARKAMRDDVKIKEIPYAEVSNPAGGTTVIIG